MKDIEPPQRVPAPLCVDLDGTLIRTDLLHEAVLLLVKRNPLYVFAIPVWLLKGKAGLKDEVAKRVAIDPSTLPYNQQVLDWVRSEKEKGRHTVLATASNERSAESVASYLGCFDEVLASDGVRNLSDRTKCAELVERFGKSRFDYAGNSSKDVVIWEQCGQAIVVEANERTLKAVRRKAAVAEIIPRPRVSLRTWFRAARVHQWVKNLLVFVPLLTSHRLTNLASVKSALILFFALSSMASATYVCNDLLDLSDDRKHSTKSSRPFASGEISISQAIIFAIGLFAVAVFLAFYLSLPGRIVLGCYLALTLAYSFWLKRKLILDVLILASLYTIRIIAGGVTTQIRLSDWLLSFSLFLFISLAICKRSSELMNLLKSNKTRTNGRFYETGDLEPLNICGMCSGILACLLMLLYGSSQQAQSLYKSPRFLYLLCPILFYWISRLWVLTFRGVLKEDPILFAIHDKVSYVVMAAMIAVIALATFIKVPFELFLQ